MKKTYEMGLPVSGKGKAIAFAQILDGNKLLRLHPHWFVEDFEDEGENFSAGIRDHATDAQFPISAELRFDDAQFPSMTFNEGPVEKIAFIEKEGFLGVTVTWGQESVAAEEEEDILRWLTGIREYVRLYLKTTPITLFFRLLMNGMLLRMNPSQRKISMMIYKITVVEIIVFFAIIAGFLLFVK